MAARIRCIIPRCSCRKKLGVHQAQFELLLAEGKTTNEALEEIGCTLMCCRANILCPPTYPLLAFNRDIFIDKVKISSFSKSKGSVTKDGPVLYLENSPGFPTNLPSKK